MIKGKYGYIKAKRNNLIKWLVIDVLFAVVLFVIGLFLNDFSKANIFTIFAMLFTIPGAKIVVSMVVIAPFKALSKESYDSINNKVGDSKSVLYDLVLTSPEKVMYIQSMCITNEAYVVLPNINKRLDREHMKKYIKKHMSNYGYEKNIVIVEDKKDYLDKIDLNQLEVDKIDDIVKTLMILQV